MDIHTFIGNYREAFGQQAGLPIVFWYSDQPEAPAEKVNGCFFQRDEAGHMFRHIREACVELAASTAYCFGIEADYFSVSYLRHAFKEAPVYFLCHAGHAGRTCHMGFFRQQCNSCMKSTTISGVFLYFSFKEKKPGTCSGISVKPV